MQPNWKKILLWVVLLTIILTLYAMWKLNRTERELQTFISTELAPTDTSGGLHVQNVSISARKGTLRLDQITWYSARDTMAWSASSLTLGIGTWKSLQMGILPAAFVLARLDETRIQVRDLRTSDGLQADLYDPVSASVTLFGSPFQLLPVIVEQRFPGSSVRLQANADGLSGEQVFQLLSDVVEIPVRLEPLRAWAGVKLSTEVGLDPSTGRLSVNNFRIDGPAASELVYHTTLFYDDPEGRRKLNALQYPSRFSAGLRFRLPDDGAFSLIPLPGFGDFRADEFRWSASGSMNPVDSVLVTDIASHISEMTFHISHPSLFPAPRSLGDLESMFTLFGVPTNRFDFESVTAEVEQYDAGGYAIRSFELTHMNFRARFNGSISIDDPSRLASAPLHGNIRIDRLSEGLQNATLNIETLFGIRLERDDDSIILPLRGTLGAPRLDVF